MVRRDLSAQSWVNFIIIQQIMRNQSDDQIESGTQIHPIPLSILFSQNLHQLDHALIRLKAFEKSFSKSPFYQLSVQQFYYQQETIKCDLFDICYLAKQTNNPANTDQEILKSFLFYRNYKMEIINTQYRKEKNLFLRYKPPNEIIFFYPNYKNTKFFPLKGSGFFDWKRRQKFECLISCENFNEPTKKFNYNLLQQLPLIADIQQVIVFPEKRKQIFPTMEMKQNQLRFLHKHQKYQILVSFLDADQIQEDIQRYESMLFFSLKRIHPKIMRAKIIFDPQVTKVFILRPLLPGFKNIANVEFRQLEKTKILKIIKELLEAAYALEKNCLNRGFKPRALRMQSIFLYNQLEVFIHDFQQHQEQPQQNLRIITKIFYMLLRQKIVQGPRKQEQDLLCEAKEKLINPAMPQEFKEEIEILKKMLFGQQTLFSILQSNFFKQVNIRDPISPQLRETLNGIYGDTLEKQELEKINGIQNGIISLQMSDESIKQLIDESMNIFGGRWYQELYKAYKFAITIYFGKQSNPFQVCLPKNCPIFIFEIIKNYLSFAQYIMQNSSSNKQRSKDVPKLSQKILEIIQQYFDHYLKSIKDKKPKSQPINHYILKLIEKMIDFILSVKQLSKMTPQQKIEIKNFICEHSLPKMEERMGGDNKKKEQVGMGIKKMKTIKNIDIQ